MKYLLMSIFSIFLCQNNFDANRAFDLVLEQCSLGPRYPGSDGHLNCRDLIVEKISKYGNNVLIDTHKIEDPLTNDSVSIYNIFHQFNPEKDSRLLLIAHWDTRRYADMDPDTLNHKQPVLGANDGASGVAVLLTILETLNQKKLKNIGVDFLFADAEDMGLYGDPESWAIGSRLFSEKYPSKLPQFGICVDMVADKDLDIEIEKYSYNMAPSLVSYIWGIAKEKQYDDIFKSKLGSAIIDDHLSFSMMTGVPSINIIDLNYKYWHTVNDIPENISKESLDVVGSVLIDFIYRYDSNVK